MIESVRALTARTRWATLGCVAVMALLITALLKPFPMPLSYHHFADQRSIFGVPHALDVLSNIAFAISGILGLWFVLRSTSALTADQKWSYGAMFAGLLLTSIGSAYYHLAPDNARLIWDRLPMTIVMAGFVTVLVADRLQRRILWMLPLLVGMGVAVVLQWSWSERQGHGDVRWYVLYQALAIGSGVALLVMFPARQDGTRALAIAVAANIAAKVFELLDKPIFAVGGMVSGHTLKHLSAGLGFLPLVAWLAQMTTRELTGEAKPEVITTREMK